MCCDDPLKFKVGDWVLHNLQVAYVDRAGKGVKNNGLVLDYGSYLWHLDNDQQHEVFPLTQEALRVSWYFTKIDDEFCNTDVWDDIIDLWQHRSVIRKAWELAMRNVSNKQYCDAQKERIGKYVKAIKNKVKRKKEKRQ